MRELVISGQVQAGTVLCLDTIPVPFLGQAPLLEGQWLDRHVVELAEMGGLLKEEGYRALEDDDGHPLASARIVGDDGHEADIDMITLFAKTAADNLAKSKGRATEIYARPYLHFDDYCAWQRRRAKAIVPSTLHEGLETLSWNTWIEI